MLHNTLKGVAVPIDVVNMIASCWTATSPELDRCLINATLPDWLWSPVMN